MTWFSAIPDVLVCIGLFLGPGLLVAYLGGLRGITAWATAPLVTVATVATVAVLGGFFNFRFGLWPVVAGTAVVACLSAGLSLLLSARGRERPPRDPRSYSLAVLVGAVVAAVIGAVTFVTGITRPDAISETWDATYHYNAIRYIELTGKASPLTIATLGQPGGTGHYGGFYPDAWHLMAALLGELTGASMPVVSTVTCLVVAVVVWPLACLLLARHLFGNSGSRAAAAGVITGLLSSLFGPFPWMMMGWGALWPNSLGMAMAPAGVALAMSITRTSDTDSFGAQRWLFAAAAAVAIAIGHPNSALSVAVICAFPFLMAIGPYVAGQYARHTLRTTLILLIILPVVAIGFLGVRKLPAVRYVFGQFWAPFESPGASVVHAFTNATDGQAANWILGAFLLIGMITCFVWRQRRWLVCAELIFVALYVGSAAIGSHLSRLFTGFWYDDSHRLAGTLPIVAIPLATIGVLAFGEWVHQVASRTAVVARRPGFALAVPLTVGTVVGVAAAAQSVPANAQVVGSAFSTVGDQAFVGPQKLQFLRTVARVVPRSALVADNPIDGTSYLFALTGTRVLFPQMNPLSNNSNMTYLAANLVQVADNPQVCDLVRRYGVGYMVVAPDDYVSSWAHWFYRGVGYPAGDPGFRLIDADGSLKLYKITICQQRSHPAQPIDAASGGSG